MQSRFEFTNGVFTSIESTPLDEVYSGVLEQDLEKAGYLPRFDFGHPYQKLLKLYAKWHEETDMPFCVIIDLFEYESIEVWVKTFPDLLALINQTTGLVNLGLQQEIYETLSDFSKKYYCIAQGRHSAKHYCQRCEPERWKEDEDRAASKQFAKKTFAAALKNGIPKP